jgi:hypothetical protein
MYKTFGILGLFLLLVIILIINPRVIHSAYNNILGRIILIVIIIFFSMNSVTLGLLAALCLIIASNMFFIHGSFIEGLENINTDTGISGSTIGDDTQTTSTSLSDKKVNIITNALSNAKDAGAPMDGSKISELKAQAESQGVDRQSIQESIQSKSSKTIPVDKTSFSSTYVNPSDSTKEGFGSKY